MTTLEQIIIREARAWAADCEWLDGDQLDTYTDAQILRGVDRHYEGGLNAFEADIGVLLPL